MTIADTPQPAAGAPRLPITFQGRAKDYFVIWIVNVLLTAVTLGIYSAWAKVRRMQFFYGNTRLDGDGFAYTARPIAILKGRLLVVAFIVVLGLLQWALPLQVKDLVALIILPLYPWAIDRSLRFGARVTVWRNIRFGWTGTYVEACRVLLLWPIVTVLSLGTLFPFAARALREYLANNYRFGTAKFSAKTRIGPYYSAYGLTVLLVLAVVAVVLVPVSIATFGKAGALDTQPLQAQQIFGVAFAAVFFFTIFFVGGFFVARARNILLKGMEIEGGHRFDCDLSGLKVVWINLSNSIAVILSLGLLWPWAAVRRWRYFAQAATVIPAGPLDRFIDQQAKAVSATGAEFADIEGFDLSV